MTGNVFVTRTNVRVCGASLSASVALPMALYKYAYDYDISDSTDSSSSRGLPVLMSQHNHGIPSHAKEEG